LAVNITVATALILSTVYVGARAPEMHGQWIRSKVGSKTYLIYEPRSGSGTGFAVKAPSGKTYIVTNDHVCEVSKDGKSVMVRDEDGKSMRRKIIKKSDRSDLCLVEGWPGVEGLKVSSSAPEIGQIVASVGHPSGYDITLSRGEIIMRDDVMIPVGPISFIDPSSGKEQLVPAEDGGVTLKQCSMPKNKVVTVDQQIFIFVFRIKMCMNVTEKAYFTNMLIQPGSSGSPVVNFYGNIVGVVFASDRAGWGVLVSHKDLTDFLSKY